MSEHPSLEDLALYVDGKLADPRVIEQHIDECSDCAAEVVLGREMRDMDSLGLMGRTAPSGFSDRHDHEEFAEFAERGVTTLEGQDSHRIERKDGRGTLDQPNRPLVSLNGVAAPQRGFARWRRLAVAGAIAASLLIGLLAGLAWNRTAAGKPFEVVVAQADSRLVGARGKPDEARVVGIKSARRGFASIIALFQDDSPMVFPSRAAGAIPVLPGEHVESPPLPPGLRRAAVLLVVITEQPAPDVIRQIVDETVFRPDQIEDLQRLLAEKLKASNYRWAAFATVVLKQS